MYRFECESEQWQAPWTKIGKHFYGEAFVPSTLHLADCKKRISEILKVELDDVIVYSGETPIL